LLAAILFFLDNIDYYKTLSTWLVFLLMHASWCYKWEMSAANSDADVGVKRTA
jgi:hypothetical protein